MKLNCIIKEKHRRDFYLSSALLCIKSYYDFLEDAKSRELCIKFLSGISIDLSEFNITSYADKFDGELESIINIYLDGEYALKIHFK